MNIRIYQVNMKRDVNNVGFSSYENLEKWQGTSAIDSTIYDKVFSGEVECKNLEDVYVMFNRNHPYGYKARSLSKSDIVEVIDTDGASKFHYVDTFGYKQVDFEPDKATVSERYLDLSEKKNIISVLLVEPEKYPRMIEIENTLEAMQKVVDGDIEEYMPFEDEVAIICNDESKMNGMKPNRAVYSEDEKKEMMDIIFGQFFIVYAPIESENFKSLPKELADKYREKFKYPERFAKGANQIYAFPFSPKGKDMER